MMKICTALTEIKKISFKRRERIKTGSSELGGLEDNKQFSIT